MMTEKRRRSPKAMEQGKILLVDDEPNLLSSFKRQFRHEFDVHTVSCGRAALEKIRRDGPFAVVVSDQGMPGMSGIELFRALNAEGDPSVRIMLTGLGDQHVAASAVNEGHVFRFHNKSGTDEDLRRSISDGVARFAADAARREGAQAAAIRAARRGMPEFGKIRDGLASALTSALQEEQFQLVYQPQFAVATERMVGVEALLRWSSPEHGHVSPDIFIPVLEETGLIVPVGRWVLQRACAQLKAFQDQGCGDIRMAVNLSPLQLMQDDLAGLVAGVLHDNKVDAASLELEITESDAIETDTATIGRMENLRSLGVSLAVDDFGMGYSTFSYLTRFPVNRLKVDKSLLRDLVETRQDRTVTQSIIDLGHCLGMSVTVEGVERRAQFDVVQGMGCDECQGFLFSAPIPQHALPDFIRRWDSHHGPGLRPVLPNWKEGRLPSSFGDEN